MAAVTARETLLARLRENPGECRAYLRRCSGRWFRGEAGPDSDLDVLVVRPDSVSGDEPVWQRQLNSLERMVARWTGILLSWSETTGPTWRALAGVEEPLIETWRQDAFQLAGEPLRPLLARAAVDGAVSASCSIDPREGWLRQSARWGA